MVEDFLRVTYPQIIAMMITYRCVVEQLKEVYKDGFTPKVTLEDIKTVGRQTRNNQREDLEVLVSEYDDMED
jgi:hypothetical protein